MKAIQFKQIRYYGIYARHRESDKKLNLAVPKEKRRLILSFNRWRNCIAASFGCDPLKCPHCGETMALMDLYIKHKRVPLEQMYEKVMSKARRCRSLCLYAFLILAQAPPPVVI